MNENLTEDCSSHLKSDRLPVMEKDISLEPGYRLDPVVTGLTYPTSVTFDDEGNVFVGEAGYSYGPAKSDGMGRILKVGMNGKITEVARGFRGPMTSITWHNGFFYVAEGAYPGSIVRVSKDGQRKVLVKGLRSGGDHFTSEIAFARDGTMFFGVGSFTNSAIIGLDNFFGGWLPQLRRQHDVPCRNYVLVGRNYVSPDPFALVDAKLNLVQTGAFKPFGVPSYPGEVISGQLFSNGVLYRSNPDGSGMHVFADGFRNLFGLGFSPDGRLYAVDHGYDERGSRPIAESPDPLWAVIPGGWYGWPDFVAGEPVTSPKFRPPGQPQPQFVLAMHPPLADRPVVNFAHHSATMKFCFSINPAFGFKNEMFAAQYGANVPFTGREKETAGFKVVRVDLQTRQIRDFLVLNRPGPGGTGPARPVDVKFDPGGNHLYIVDFGVMEADLSGIIPWARAGALWRIKRKR